jgi:hypothetical protein
MMKKKKKTKELTEEEKVELKSEGELPKKSVRNREDKQLTWFFVIILILFASFLIPYFFVESSKVFEYGGVDWSFEDDVSYYHGRFIALSNIDLIYNIYIRNDPRENNIPTEGTFNMFKHGAVISTSPEFDMCRGDASRVMIDLGSFLKTAVGVGSISVGSTDQFVAVETKIVYAQCNTVSDRTIVIVDKGDSRVVKNESYPYCYTIYVDDCNDASSVEKFMLKSIEDFGGSE